ncbi:MAG: alkaline phosphatase family protein [Candidatus Aenigmatarchaeota archaeon]
MTFLVLGVDAATWTMIKPNLDELPNFKRLMEEGEPGTVHLEQKPYSPLIWCGMFSGTYPDEHGHKEYIEDDEIVEREEIPVDFVWDKLDSRCDIRAVNVPFVVPPYVYNVDYEPVGYGLPTEEKEWNEELEKLTEKTVELIEDEPDVLISIFTSLDRIQHFHWGEEMVLDWYKKMDQRLGEILFDTGFLEDEDNQLILISDHGFCSFGESEVQTLPKETQHGKLKGDHHEDAIVITRNVERKIKEPQDVCRAIMDNYS